MNTIQLILEMLQLLEGLAPEIINIFDKHKAINPQSTNNIQQKTERTEITSGQLKIN